MQDYIAKLTRLDYKTIMNCLYVDGTGRPPQ